jgi:hypothetical protein
MEPNVRLKKVMEGWAGDGSMLAQALMGKRSLWGVVSSKRARAHSPLQARGSYKRVMGEVPGRSLGRKILNGPLTLPGQ